MSLKQVKSLVQFSRGNALVWDALVTPIPDGVMIFSIDDGVFKLGNGIDQYSALPVEFTFDELVGSQGGVSDKFTTPTVEQAGEIVNISGGLYSASGTTIVSILSSIDALEVSNITQDATIASLLASMLNIDVSISTGANNNLIVVTGGKLADSGTNITDITAAAIAGSTAQPGPHLEEPIWYSDADLTYTADIDQLMDDNTYYCEVVGFHDNTDNPVFDITTDNANVTIGATAVNNVFSVLFSSAVAADQASMPVVLYGSIDDGTGNSGITKAMVVTVENPFTNILVAVYGGTGNDVFYGTIIDSNGNIICTGYTSSEGIGGISGLVVKFDPQLNLLSRKYYGAGNNDQFINVAVDSADNIYCVGLTMEGAGTHAALVVKFDNDLNLVATKNYSGAATDYFYDVAVDSQDNIICAGYTMSEGAGDYDALVVKFSSSLAILARKIYGGIEDEYLFGVAVDSQDNIIVSGYTRSEGAGGDTALVVKFDNDLNKLAGKIYGSNLADRFYGVAIDSQDNIICCGHTRSEGVATASDNPWVIKFDSDLNKLVGKTYSGASSDSFSQVAVDSQDNIICVGKTNSEGIGVHESLVIKFDSSLGSLAKKYYGGLGEDHFHGVVIDSQGTIICCGYTTSEGTGGDDTVVMKLTSNVPAGSYTGTVLSNLTLADSALTLADSAQTLTDSNLTLADSNLTLADGTITLADSNLTLESDTLM